MKQESSLFDSIRVKPDEDRRASNTEPRCQWEGCQNAGTHKAPMGRGREGEFFLFCIDHVREYNKSYNYFSGMSDDAVARYQKDALTGHRPTWRMGMNGKQEGNDAATFGGKAGWSGRADDPYGLFEDNKAPRREAPKRRVRSLEKKAFDTLDMDETSDADRIKSRYKELVKRHHPDANGGDRSSEERLRQIIQAYSVLKQAGYC
ncbi:MAG: J domain-containing protein [Pseudomonadota bacterium]